MLFVDDLVELVLVPVVHVLFLGLFLGVDVPLGRLLLDGGVMAELALLALLAEALLEERAEDGFRVHT